MPVIVITTSASLTAMHQVVEKFGPDHRYAQTNQACYLADGECSCLIAHVLHAQGVSLDVLADLDDGDGGSTEIQDVEHPAIEFENERLRTVLGVAQHKQDTYATWADALLAAVTVAPTADVPPEVRNYLDNLTGQVAA